MSDTEHVRRRIISLNDVERALGLCSGTNQITCWAGVSPGVFCTQDISGRLEEVIEILWEISSDLQTYDAVQDSTGIDELLYRLAVQLVCGQPHQEKHQKRHHQTKPDAIREDILFKCISRALRERLERWDEMSSGNPRPLELEQRDDEAHPVRHLLGVMRNSNIGATPGYVYCFSDKHTKGFLKIGFARSSDVPQASLSTASDSYRLFKRLSEQVIKCQFDMKLEFYERMPCAGLKIESLVHATLHAKSWTVVKCKTATCTTQHREWFRATREEVEGHIRLWKRFSTLHPWSTSGSLLPAWDALAVQHLRAYGDMTVKAWIDGYWKEILHNAEIEQDSELQVLGEQLRRTLRKLSWVNKQIQRMEQDKARRVQQPLKAENDLLKKKGKFNSLEREREEIQADIRAASRRLVVGHTG